MAEDWKSRVDPELRPVLRRIPNVTFGPLMMRAFRWLLRIKPFRLPAGVHHEAVPHGVLMCPATGSPRGALLWIHGGGRILGSARQDDAVCARLVERLGVAVLSVEYRLAPEHPFPAGLDDCHAAFGWLAAWAAERDLGPLLVAGESAGGGLAAELCQRLYDEAGPQPAAQLLVYPMLDDRTATIEAHHEAGHLIWNNRSNHFAWQAWLGQPPGAENTPRYAVGARRADLSGLPPCWLMVGELDLFLDENRRYLARLEEAGVETSLHFVPGGVHGMFQVGQQEPPILRIWDSLAAFAERYLPPTAG